MTISAENQRNTAFDMSVDQITRQLTKVVAREVEHLDSLLQLLTDQQRLLVESDVVGVEQNVQKQDQALIVSRELEAERRQLLGSLAEQIDGDPQELTLSRLTELLSSSYASRLKQMQKTMLSITGNIQHVRRQNEMLINRSMMHIRETVRLMAGHMATAPEYAPRTTTKQNAALVNRVG